VDGRGVAGVGRAVDARDEGVELGDRDGILRLGERLGGQPLHQPDDLEVVAHHLGVERRDERAAVGLHRDEPVARELDDRLAHGQPAHAEVVGEVGLGDAVAGSQLTGEHQLADVLGHELAGRTAFEADGPTDRCGPGDPVPDLVPEGWTGDPTHGLIMYQRW